jgi:hypothetical protein
MKTTRPLLAVLAGLLFSLPASAAEVTGVVARTDPEKKELLLEGRRAARGQALTFALDGETQILFGRQPGAPMDLAVGQRVRVVYETRDDRQVARIIHVAGARPRAAAAPADTGTIIGVLRRVALTDREVVIIGPGPKGPMTETTVAVPESARIMKEGKPVTLEALKEDDPVRVRAEMRDSRLTATAIEVGPGAAAESSDVVPRLRLALKLADYFLKQMEKPAPKP